MNKDSMEFEIKLDDDEAERKLTNFEQKAQRIGKKIDNFSFGGLSSSLENRSAAYGSVMSGGRVAGSFGRKASSYIPGFEQMAARFVGQAGPLLAPNTWSLMEKGQNRLNALDETIQDFGLLGKSASPQSIRDHFDMKLKYMNEYTDNASAVRQKIGADRLEPATDIVKGLPAAAIKDFFHDFKSLSQVAKKILGDIF